LIDKKTGPFKPAEFHDRYIDALHRLIDKKAKSKSNKRVLEDVEEPSGGSKSNVIDLMAALKKSVGDSGSRTGKAAPASKSAADKGSTAKAPAKKAEAKKPAAKKPAATKSPAKTAKTTSTTTTRSRKRA
jgi:DNA end-binding protein Ku